MPELVIKIQVTADQTALFADRDMMVTPLSDFEGGQLAVALEALEEVARKNRQCLSTLQQVLETTGSNPDDIARTLVMLQEMNALSVEQIVFVRTLLGRSARVERRAVGRGTLQ